MNAAQKRAFTEKWIGRREQLYVAEGDEEPPLSRTNPKYSGRNRILDGRIRIEPKGNAHWIVECRQWVIWGYRWNRHSKTWSQLQLFHCRSFELEDEPI